MYYVITKQPFNDADPPKDGETSEERMKREADNETRRTTHELELTVIRFYRDEKDPEAIASFTYDELLEKFWQEYWDENELDPDARPEDSMMLEDYVQSLESPTDVLFRAFYGHDYNRWDRKEAEPFNPNREYFAFNGYGNLVSICEYDLTHYLAGYIDVEELAKWVSDNKDEGDL